MALFLFADTTPNVDDEKSKPKNCVFFSNLFTSVADCRFYTGQKPLSYSDILYQKKMRYLRSTNPSKETI